jgi:hypothetical protein
MGKSIQAASEPLRVLVQEENYIEHSVISLVPLLRQFVRSYF